MANPEPHVDRPLADWLLGTLLRPRATLDALSRQPAWTTGASAVAWLGLTWAALSVLLWNAGRAPRFVFLPIPADHYYLVQAVIVLPVMTALWWLYSEVAHRLCRAAGGEGSEAGVRSALGFAYAVPMMVHVGLELIVYLCVGFSGLSLVARFSMPLAALWVWALSALTLRVTHRVAWSRAAWVSFVALSVQAFAGATLLR